MKSVKVIIRPAIVTDAEQLATLFMRAWHISLKDIVPNGFLDRFKHEIQKNKYIDRAKDPEYNLIVAECDGNIIGMIGAKDNNLETLNYQKEIRALYVDPDFQRQGIGSLLLIKILSEFKKHQVRNAMLWCIEANRTAHAFYKRHGGKIIETNISPPEEYSTMPHVIYAWDFSQIIH